jgi:hypothetical protein
VVAVNVLLALYLVYLSNTWVIRTDNQHYTYGGTGKGCYWNLKNITEYLWTEDIGFCVVWAISNCKRKCYIKPSNNLKKLIKCGNE